MRTAGYCDSCGQNVYVTFEGACPNGHGPEHLSGHYTVDEGPAPLPVTPAPRGSSGLPKWAIPAGIAVLMVLGLGFAAFGVQFMGDLRSASAYTDCYTNQISIEDAAVAYSSQQGEAPTTIDALVPEYLPERPQCPENGYYEYDFGAWTLDCSVHGYYAPPPAATTYT